MILRTSRNFGLLWSGQVVSVVGDGMQRIALLWWARQTGGNGLLTAVALSTMVPAICCSPLGGWLADRFDRRRSMIAADLVRTLTVGALAVVVLGRHQSPVALCALVAVTAMATAVFDPSYAAAVPSIVDPEDRPAANGLNLANSAVGGVLGPLVGGVLIAWLGVGTVLVINAATFIWSASFVALARLPRPAGSRDPSEPSAARTSDAPMSTETTVEPGGVWSVLRDPGLRRLIGLASALNMLAAPIPLLVVALAVDRFRAGVGVYGALEITVSAGILAGALLAGPLMRRSAMARSVAVPMTVVGVFLGGAGSVPIGAAAVAFGLAGFAIAVTNTSLITELQRTVPAEVQGRVFGVVGALGEGLRPAGLALGAPLLAVAGVSGAFAAIGAGMLVATAAWGRPRRIDRQSVATPADSVVAVSSSAHPA